MSIRQILHKGNFLIHSHDKTTTAFKLKKSTILKTPDQANTNP